MRVVMPGSSGTWRVHHSSEWGWRNIKKGKGLECESHTQGLPSGVGVLPHAQGRGLCYSHPSCKSFFFLLLLVSGLFEECLQISRAALTPWMSWQKSAFHLLTSERSALVFMLRMWKPGIAHLWTSSQGNNSCRRGLGYFFDIHHKTLYFLRHPQTKTKIP